MSHEDAIQKVLKAVLRNLINARNSFGEIEIIFWPEEKLAIEYFLKDVAKRSVIQEITEGECVHMMSERILRLTESDQYEWSRIIETICENSSVLTIEDLNNFNDLHTFFTKKEAARKQKLSVS